MSKALRKAIMHMSRSKNIKYNKYKTEDNWTNCKKQINFCVNLLHKTKTEYFQKSKCKRFIRQQKILQNHETIF